MPSTAKTSSKTTGRARKTTSKKSTIGTSPAKKNGAARKTSGKNPTAGASKSKKSGAVTKAAPKKGETRTARRKVGNAEVQRFLDAVEHPTRRSDSFVLDEMFQRISGEKPRLRGSIVAYGSYTYELASGEKAQAMRIGFSPRKQNLVVYIMPGFTDSDTMERLGKHKTGRSCLYLTRLANVDLEVLEELARKAWDIMAERYPD